MTRLGDGADLWRVTLQHSPIGMSVVSPEGRPIVVNRALCEMLGRDEDDLTSRNWQELSAPEDIVEDLACNRAALAGEIDSYRIRKRYLHADGHAVWGDLSVTLVRDAAGEPAYFISQVLDITEQRQNEERLEAAHAEMEAIFDTVNVGLLLIGPDGTYERMNKQHSQTMHLPFPAGHEGAAGQLGEVYLLDGRTPMPREDMPSYRATQGEEFDDYRYWVGADSADRAAYSTSARQIRGPHGERLGAVLAYQEITDLVRAIEVKDELVASVSHELRTPLTAMLGYLEILAERDDLPVDAAAQIRTIQRNTGRLQALLTDLLLIGQVAAGRLELQVATLDLCAVVRDAVEAARPAADQGGVSLRADVPDRLRVPADEHRLRQVLDNLLSNAVKYSRSGDSVAITLAADDDEVVIEVADTGRGIPAHEVGQVFGRFFRGDEATEQQLPGTGIGLNIVSSIVAAHGGTVSVDSELGRGSTFRVVLPRARAHPTG